MLWQEWPQFTLRKEKKKKRKKKINTGPHKLYVRNYS